MTTNVNATSSKNESQLEKRRNPPIKGFASQKHPRSSKPPISIVEDKPILFDYWTDSLVKRFL
jgi:hypothetical protein